MEPAGRQIRLCACAEFFHRAARLLQGAETRRGARHRPVQGKGEGAGDGLITSMKESAGGEQRVMAECLIPVEEGRQKELAKYETRRRKSSSSLFLTAMKQHAAALRCAPLSSQKEQGRPERFS